MKRQEPYTGELFDTPPSRAETLSTDTAEKPYTGELFDSRPEEGWVDWGQRQLARTASRIGETIAGMPGDIVKGAGSVLAAVSQPGQSGMVPGVDIAKLVGDVGRILPGQHELKNITSKMAPEGYLEPKGDIEAGFDKFFTTAASLLGAGPKAALGGAVGAELGALAGKHGSKLLGASESGQNTAEFLGSLFGSMYGLTGGAKDATRLKTVAEKVMSPEKAKAFLEEAEKSSKINNFIRDKFETNKNWFKGFNPFILAGLGGLGGESLAKLFFPHKDIGNQLNLVNALSTMSLAIGMPAAFAGNIEKVVRMSRKYPEFGKALVNFSEAAAKNASPLAMKNLRKLNNIYEEHIDEFN